MFTSCPSEMPSIAVIVSPTSSGLPRDLLEIGYHTGNLEARSSRTPFYDSPVRSVESQHGSRIDHAASI